MMNFALRDLDDLKTKIHSFRVSDLQSLVASFGRSRNGKKQDLQNRALEILTKQPSDVDILAFKRKIYELYRVAQDEAKQTHYDFQAQQQQRAVNQAGNAYMNPGQYTLPPQSRPINSTIIYPNGGIVSGNGYPHAGVYQGQVRVPTIQPPTSITSNLGSTVQIMNPPTYANVKFKSLPFYRIRHEILKPFILKMKTNGKNHAGPQLFQIPFVLTCDIASDIAMHRDYSKNEFTVQAQLRICTIDNSNNPAIENDDFLPFGLNVRMNDKPCPLPPFTPSGRPNSNETRRVPLPINITQFLKLSPMNVNKLAINWTPEQQHPRTYVACVNVVEKLTSKYLLDQLKEKPYISVDITKKTIASHFKRVVDDDDDDENADDDDDVAATIIRVSLQCPLVKCRMAYPAKGKNCTHLQCFDGSAYISCNEKKSFWNCPVCNRPLNYDDLLIDQYFVDVLASEDSSNCQEVQIFIDGSWKVFEEENVIDVNDKSKNLTPDSPSEILSSTNSKDLTSQENDQKHALSDNSVSTSGISASVPDSFVDLTEDDDEMDGVVTEVQTAVDEASELPTDMHAEDIPTTNISPDDSNSGAEKITSPISILDQPSPSLTTSKVSPPSPLSHDATTPRVSPAPSPLHDMSQPTSPISPDISLRINESPNPSETIENETDTYSNTENITEVLAQDVSDSSPSSLGSSPKPSNPMVLSPTPSPTLRPNADQIDENEACADHESTNDDFGKTSAANGGSSGARDSIRNSDGENVPLETPSLGFDSDDDMPMIEELAAPMEDTSTLSTPEMERMDESPTASVSSLDQPRSPVPSEMANLNIGN